VGRDRSILTIIFITQSLYAKEVDRMGVAGRHWSVTVMTMLLRYQVGGLGLTD